MLTTMSSFYGCSYETSEPSLMHHGIKGMKWGVRRSPEQLGHYSRALAKRTKRLGASAKAHRQAVEEMSREAASSARNYVKTSQARYIKRSADALYDKGLSKDDAAAEAEKRAAFRKNLIGGVAVGAGVALGAAGAYYLYQTRQEGKRNVDSLIKAGTTIQTLSHDKERIDNGMAFYTNFDAKDISIYEGTFSRSGGEYKYAIQSEAQRDVKVAGRTTGEKVFKQLMRDDPEFRKDVKKAHVLGANLVYGNAYDRFNATILPKDRTYADPEIRKYFEKDKKITATLNEDLVSPKGGVPLKTFEERYYEHARSDPATKAAKRFYQELSKLGYGAVEDVNDQKYSNLRGRHPAIVFDRSAFGAASASRVTPEQAAAGKAVARQEIPKIKASQKPVKNLSGTALGVGSAAVTALFYGALTYDTARDSKVNARIRSEYKERRDALKAQRKAAVQRGASETELRRIDSEIKKNKNAYDDKMLTRSYGRSITGFKGNV